MYEEAPKAEEVYEGEPNPDIPTYSEMLNDSREKLAKYWVNGDPLDFEERQGLTILGDNVSFQIRGDHDDEAAVLCVRKGAKRSSENGNPVFVSRKELIKLHALLVEAKSRGFF